MLKKIIKQILRYFGIAVKPTFRIPLLNKNRVMSYSIGDYEIQINRSHVLPFITKYYPECNKNLPRLVAFLQTYFTDLIVMDIGANIGDTVAFIKSESDVPIICIEGNDKYFSLLKKNIKQFNNVFAFKKYFGEKKEIIDFQVNTSGGTSGLQINSGKNKTTEIDVETLDSFIENHQFSPDKIKIIKIDTDGFDMKILRGGINHLTNVKPILFFEYDPEMLIKVKENGLDTLRILKESGYENILFYDSFGRFMQSIPLSNFVGIEQMHNYLSGYKAPFDYYDLCIFHSDNNNIAEAFIKAEMGNQLFKKIM